MEDIILIPIVLIYTGILYIVYGVSNMFLHIIAWVKLK